MSDHILIERAGETGAINVIRFNRPEKKNAITRAMYAAMAGALSDGEADESVRVHVMLGTPGAFSSGNDMQDFMAVAMGASKGAEVFDFLIALATLKKPVVSGVDGLAIGIGTTIHMHCDLTFATCGLAFPHAVCRSCACPRGWLQPAGASCHGPSEGLCAARRGHPVFRCGGRAAPV
jgi:enoyl-CoA hydratase/carnithine racemase